jgi:soluble lytic murein transglycosylase-like protein
MGALSVAIAVTAAISPLSTSADPVARWQPIISEASIRFGIPPNWIERVIRAESGGRATREGRLVRSRVGAIGLMQLMPATWADMRQIYHLGADPDDPHDNIIAGTAYLRQMYDRFGYPGLFAGYNAGPARYSLSLATGERLPTETVVYLANVTGIASGVGPARRAAAVQGLFVVRHDASAGSVDGARSPTKVDVAPSLFAVRTGTP